MESSRQFQNSNKKVPPQGFHLNVSYFVMYTITCVASILFVFFIYKF